MCETTLMDKKIERMELLELNAIDEVGKIQWTYLERDGGPKSNWKEKGKKAMKKIGSTEKRDMSNSFKR